MKNPTKELLDQAVEMRLNGYGWKAVLTTTGLSHSQAELAELAFQYYMVAGGTAVEPTPENAAALRYFYGIGWGPIMVMMGLKADVPQPRLSRDRVIKLTAEATGIEGYGTRIGKGGRFAGNEPRFYADTLKGTGTAIPVGADRATALDAAEAQRLVKLDIAELKAMAADAGIKLAKGATKARIVAAIRKAG